MALEIIVRLIMFVAGLGAIMLVSSLTGFSEVMKLNPTATASVLFITYIAGFFNGKTRFD